MEGGGSPVSYELLPKHDWLGPMRMRRGLLVGLMLLLMAGVLATNPMSASANYHYYCEQSLEPGGTCPPNGSSKWWHLEENLGWDPYGNHEVCVDDYLDPSGSGY